MAIDLHPDLNLVNFGWTEKNAVTKAIRTRIAEELKEDEEQLKKYIIECLNLIYKDDKAFELCSKFPRAFHTAAEVDISGRQLGICTNDSYPDNYDKIGDGKHYVSGTLCFKSGGLYPIPVQRYRIKIDLSKLPESKVEVLKSMFSDYLNKKFELYKELHDFQQQDDSIKTVGRLYRVNPTWYEDLVKANYSRYLEVPKATKATAGESTEEAQKRRKKTSEDRNRDRLNELKKVIIL